MHLKAKHLFPYLMCGGLVAAGCQPKSPYAVDAALVEKIDSAAERFKLHADSYAGQSYDRNFFPPRFNLARYWTSFPTLIRDFGDTFEKQGYGFGFIKDQDLTQRLDPEMYNARLVVSFATRDTVTGNTVVISAMHNTPYGHKINITPLMMNNRAVTVDPALVNATIKAAGLLTAQNDSTRAAYTLYPLGETNPSAYETPALAYELAKATVEDKMIAAFKEQGIDLRLSIDSDKKTSRKIEVATIAYDDRLGQDIEIKTTQDLVNFKTVTTVAPHLRQ